MDCWTCVIIMIIVYVFSRLYRWRFVPDFNNKYVFVSGADSGFGHKLALDLDHLGVHVYAGCYTKDGMATLNKKCSQRLKTVPLDVTNQASVEQAKIFVENDLPPDKNLWGLVNNAGILGNMSFELSTLEDFQQVMDVNYFGSIRMVQVFSPLIKKSKGRIVQVASMLGRGSGSNPSYTGSKFAIEAYTDLLRRYMKRFEVKVSTIEPGCFRETFLMDETAWATVIRRQFDSLPDSKKTELGEDFVEKEIGTHRQVFQKFPLSKWNKMHMVTDSMIHALGAKHPKTRYLIGYEARAFILLTTYTPDWFLDKILELIYLWTCGRLPS